MRKVDEISLLHESDKQLNTQSTKTGYFITQLMKRYIRDAVNSKNINMPDPFLIKGGVIDNIIEAKFILIPCKTKGSLEAMKSQVGIYLTIASLSYCL